MEAQAGCKLAAIKTNVARENDALTRRSILQAMPVITKTTLEIIFTIRHVILRFRPLPGKRQLSFSRDDD
jgi:hypothetical protein